MGLVQTSASNMFFKDLRKQKLRDMKWKVLMMLICAGSEAAKWSAIQKAAHF